MQRIIIPITDSRMKSTSVLVFVAVVAVSLFSCCSAQQYPTPSLYGPYQYMNYYQTPYQTPLGGLQNFIGNNGGISLIGEFYIYILLVSYVFTVFLFYVRL